MDTRSESSAIGGFRENRFGRFEGITPKNSQKVQFLQESKPTDKGKKHEVHGVAMMHFVESLKLGTRSHDR